MILTGLVVLFLAPCITLVSLQHGPYWLYAGVLGCVLGCCLCVLGVLAS